MYTCLEPYNETSPTTKTCYKVSLAATVQPMNSHWQPITTVQPINSQCSHTAHNRQDRCLVRLKGVGPVDDREFIDISRVERSESYVATAMIEGSFLDYVPAAASGTTRWLHSG